MDCGREASVRGIRWGSALLLVCLVGCGSDPTSAGIPDGVAGGDAQPAESALPTPTLVPTFIHLEADGSGDYASLDEAVRAAPMGSVITLGPGTFYLSHRLNVLKSLQLTGAGMDQTEVVSTADGYVIRFSGTGPFVVEDVTFRHAGENIADVVVVRGGTFSAVRCRFAGAFVGDGIQDRAGLWVYGETAGEIRDCVASGNGNVGIYVSGVAQPELVGNECSNNDDVGIVYWGAVGGTARQNTCSGSLVGITVAKDARPTLEENVCVDNQLVGIVYAQDGGGTASGNECARNDIGILVMGKAGPTLEGNTCVDNTTAGIGYSGEAAGMASNNQCLRNESGIWVSGQARPALAHNVCSENTYAGISYGQTAGGTATGNVCVGNGRYGILLEVTSNPSLASNDCRDNGFMDIDYVD